MTGVLIRERQRGNLTQTEESPYEDEERWERRSPKQTKLAEAREGSPPEPLEGAQPCCPIDCVLRGPRTVRE